MYNPIRLENINLSKVKNSKKTFFGFYNGANYVNSSINLENQNSSYDLHFYIVHN